MIYWSLRTLFAEPLRLITSALAVAVSFILVVFFSAVFEGESDQMIAYLEAADADIWVMQKGVSNMHMASSMVWDWKADQITELPGVEDVAAILYLNGPIKVGGKDWFSYLIGIKPEHQRVGPSSLAQGKAMPAEGEAVIPEVISQLTGIGIGDEITMIDRPLRVVGLSHGTFSMASSVVFVSYEDLGNVLAGTGQYSYLMVYAKPGVVVSDLIAEIQNNIEKVNVLRSEDFIQSDWQLAVQMGAEIIQMMTMLGTILATLIVAFTAYSLIARKKQELAIAKALGFGNGQIYIAALCQSIVITSLGLLLALITAFTLMNWLPAVLPQINLTVRLHQFIPVTLIALPVAVLASLSAARTVAKVDPMTVFRN